MQRRPFPRPPSSQFVVPARLLWTSTPIAARQAKRNTTLPSPIQRDAFCAIMIVDSRLPFHFGADSSDGLEHRRPYSDASEPGARNKERGRTSMWGAHGGRKRQGMRLHSAGRTLWKAARHAGTSGGEAHKDGQQYRFSPRRRGRRRRQRSERRSLASPVRLHGQKRASPCPPYGRSSARRPG